MAHLSNGRVNFSILRELARKDLVSLLEKCPGTKAVIWDEYLTGPIGLIAEYSFLKELEVVKMFSLKPGRLPAVPIKNVIFITRPLVHLMDFIVDNLHGEEGQSRKEYQLFFVPRRSAVCEKYLKDKGVYGTLSLVDELPIEFYPLDSDVVSMEMDNTFKELYVEQDTSCLYQIARGLVTLQSLYGDFGTVLGKGRYVRQVYELMTRLRRDLGSPTPGLESPSASAIYPHFDTLLMIDRSADLVTPLVTQLTYEGLIDEFYSIKQNTVKVPGEKFQTSSDQPASRPDEGKSAPGSVKTVVLNSSEELYAELRDKNFTAVGNTLSRKAKLITAQYEERHGAKTVTELKQFVAKLPQMQAAKQSLALHTSIAELVKEMTDSDAFQEALHVEQDLLHGQDTDRVNPYIEDFICKHEPIMKVLRLICLQSASNSGLKARVLEHYKREIIQSYGYQHLVTLANLEICGLVRIQQTSSRPFTVLRRTLNLMVDDCNECQPTDISYVHSIYAPLSVRLIQWATRPGWKGIGDVLALIPGPLITESQPVNVNLKRRRPSGGSVHSSSDECRTTLVLFIGGCTYAEISALRFLSRMDDAPCDYLVATTSILNGEMLLQSVCDTLATTDGFTLI